MLVKKRILDFILNIFEFLMAANEEELKNVVMRVREESEKATLKLSIKKLRRWHRSHHFTADRRGKGEKQ